MTLDHKRNKVPVSVVIPCYNCSETVGRAVESVISQSALPEEILLVDDASMDDGRTWMTLQSLKDHFDKVVRINIIHLANNQGPAFARNTGWNASSQPYIAFLDADDAWHLKKLEIIHDIMQNHINIDLIGHGFYIGGTNSGSLSYVLSKKKHKLIRKGYYSILLMSPFVTPSIFLKKSLSERFNTQLRYCEDYEFLLRVAHKHNVYYIKYNLVQLGKEPFSGSGLTANISRMRLGEISMYFEAIKYKRSLIPILPLLIIFSGVKHFVLMGLTLFQIKKRT